MELPSNETPTITVISDKKKLNSQPFFKMAEDNDIIFSYNNAKMAVLYRPKTEKIINVAGIFVKEPPVSTGSQATTTRKAKLP